MQEARNGAVELASLPRLAEPRRTTARIGLPPRREHERAAERNVWPGRRTARAPLQRDDVLLGRLRDVTGLAIDRRQVSHVVFSNVVRRRTAADTPASAPPVFRRRAGRCPSSVGSTRSNAGSGAP